jgi:hypothetical protein
MLGPSMALLRSERAIRVDLGLEPSQERGTPVGGTGRGVRLTAPLDVGCDPGAESPLCLG